MFSKKFKVVEIRTEGGYKITHYLKGKKKDVDERVRQFKLHCKSYETFGKNGLVAWF